MLKPSDLTKAELLQVVEMLAETANEYYLDRALGRIEMQRNDAEMKHIAGISTMPETWKEIKKWLETPWEGKP